MISVRTASLLSRAVSRSPVPPYPIVSFLSVKEVGNLFLVEKSINESIIKGLLKCFSDRHTCFNTSISTAVTTQHLAIMKGLDRSIRFFGPMPSPRWAPLSTQLPAGFTLGGFGGNCNEIAYSIVYLSENPANRQPLVAAGVHNQLSALLIDQQATARAKQWAAEALGNLSRDPANHPTLMEARVHIPLRALLIDPQATPEAKQWAAEALWNLSRDPDNRQRLLADRVHISLGALLSDPQATALAKQWAAGALLNFSVAPANSPILVAAGVHTPLSALLSDPQATATAKRWAAGALGNLELTPPPRGCCVIS